MGVQITTDSLLDISLSKEQFRNLLSGLPKSPGVYKFYNQYKVPIYIGKAKNLRNRVKSYFNYTGSASKKINSLVGSIKYIEITITNTELESLLLEQHLIKKNKPKFNVQFKDDKGYPWIRFKVSQEYPTADIFLGKKDNKDKYFGPFPSSYSVRDVLAIIQKTFKLRNCSDSFFKNRTRPCMQYEINRCSAPCVGRISKYEYMNDVKLTEKFLLGSSESLMEDLYKSMDYYSKKKAYEKASIFRDKISSLREIQRNQSIVGYKTERDAICVSSRNRVTKIGVTHVKGGWVVGHENFIQKNSSIDESVLETFIKMHYLRNSSCPQTIILGQQIKNKKMLEMSLSEFHKKRIRIITKLRKKDEGLIKICKSNTKFSFNRLDKKGTKVAMEALKIELNLHNEIGIIESYDISHHSGSAAVAGCVVFSNEGKRKDKYRLFNISKKNSGNDIASMCEVIERRFNKDIELQDMPSLVIIDGGKVHLKKVIEKLDNLNLSEIPVISISKGVRRKIHFDSIHFPDGSVERISGNSLAQTFIQEIRDETHRYSISSQKKKLVKLSKSSSLDDLKGVGPKRKKILLRFFGSVEQLKKASTQDLVKVPGLGKKTANSVFKQLQ